MGEPSRRCTAIGSPPNCAAEAGIEGLNGFYRDVLGIGKGSCGDDYGFI